MLRVGPNGVLGIAPILECLASNTEIKQRAIAAPLTAPQTNAHSVLAYAKCTTCRMKFRGHSISGMFSCSLEFLVFVTTLNSAETVFESNHLQLHCQSIIGRSCDSADCTLIYLFGLVYPGHLFGLDSSQLLSEV